MSADQPEGFIPPHGGYRKLLSYQRAEIVYDATVHRTPGANYETFRKGLEHEDPASAANVVIGLIKVAGTLLSKQLRQLERAFLEEGGLRERMTAARLKERARQGSAKLRDTPERKPPSPK